MRKVKINESLELVNPVQRLGYHEIRRREVF